MYVFVKQGDTLQSIAASYGTTEDSLATVNNLEYPFIVGDPLFQKGLYATGSLAITLTQIVSKTIAVGSIFQTQSTASMPARSYQTLSQVTLTQYGQTANVAVAAVLAGSYGNVLPNTVILSPNVSGVSVTNPGPISGGRTLRVLVPGDQINIPGGSATGANSSSRMTLSQYDELGGTDLFRTPNGGLMFTTDDIMDVSGPDCVAQDIGCAITTPLGSVPDAPSFGGYVPSYIGQAGENNMARIAVLAYGQTQSDDRIASVGTVGIQQNGTFVSLQIPGTLNNGSSLTVQTSVTNSGVPVS